MLTTSVPGTSPALAFAAPAFSCRRAVVGATLQVTISGELDIATAPRLHAALSEAHAKTSTVVLDLSRLEFSDCCGVRVMLAADRRIRHDGGRLLVVRPPAEVQRFFARIGLDHQLQVVPRLPDALASVAARSRQTVAPGARAPVPAAA